MFGSTKTLSSFAVDDLDRARSFYADTLGIRVEDDPMGLLVLQLAGDRPTLVYPKPDHVPATFTVLNFVVDDVEAAVDALTSRGIVLERYEHFDHDQKGIVRGDGPPVAWFRDPAGNILSVVQPD